MFFLLQLGRAFGTKCSHVAAARLPEVFKQVSEIVFAIVLNEDKTNKENETFLGIHPNTHLRLYINIFKRGGGVGRSPLDEENDLQNRPKETNHDTTLLVKLKRKVELTTPMHGNGPGEAPWRPEGAKGHAKQMKGPERCKNGTMNHTHRNAIRCKDLQFVQLLAT